MPNKRETSTNSLYGTSTITIPDGTEALGGRFAVIDSITGTLISDGTTNRTAVLAVVGGGSTLLSISKTIATADTGIPLHLAFTTGFPIVSATQDPLTTITVAVSGTGITFNLLVTFHYRKVL